jgi:hypothetical protein
MVSQEVWFRQQSFQQLWQGPAAVAAYVSITTQLCGMALSAIFVRDLELATLCTLAISLLICGLLIVIDQVASYRNHRLNLLRFSAAKSRRRIKALGIQSKQIDRFVKTLWFDPRIEFKFRSARFRSVELIIEALDLLSQTAARYGNRGRKVFLVNQEPLVSAMRLIEFLPLENADEELTEPLAGWLAHPLEFDPEGWALPIYRES